MAASSQSPVTTTKLDNGVDGSGRWGCCEANRQFYFKEKVPFHPSPPRLRVVGRQTPTNPAVRLCSMYLLASRTDPSQHNTQLCVYVLSSAELEDGLSCVCVRAHAAP